MTPINKAQRAALHRKWVQSDQGMTYLQFRRTVTPLFGGGGCVMVPWVKWGIGIEPDGYAHS